MTLKHKTTTIFSHNRIISSDILDLCQVVLLWRVEQAITKFFLGWFGYLHFWIFVWLWLVKALCSLIPVLV